MYENVSLSRLSRDHVGPDEQISVILVLLLSKSSEKGSYERIKWKKNCSNYGRNAAMCILFHSLKNIERWMKDIKLTAKGNDEIKK